MHKTCTPRPYNNILDIFEPTLFFIKFVLPLHLLECHPGGAFPVVLGELAVLGRVNPRFSHYLMTR